MDTFAYVDRARPGEENMAIDRQLLETAERTGSAYVRLYRWSEPTLSLGHFQAGIDRNLHPPSRDLPMVVRASGGGAIVHDQEWTYSIALPIGRNKFGASKELYDAVHGALVGGLRGLGWDASQWTKPCAVEGSDNASVAASVSQSGAESVETIACGGSKSSEPLLCFQRRSCGDIVCEGYKVVGSAQRRLGGSVLQHGSILCWRSLFAPELPGLGDLGRVSLAKDSLSNMETFGRLVLSWVLDPLEHKFGCRVTDEEFSRVGLH
jgi:lipoate-protein ligase A